MTGEEEAYTVYPLVLYFGSGRWVERLGGSATHFVPGLLVYVWDSTSLGEARDLIS